ncbi:MAG: hypothetical protein JNK82_07940 [Myxococcaceae bacterium]|nr:hypothetical protein [Myxococcaceae bacterium]
MTRVFVVSAAVLALYAVVDRTWALREAPVCPPAPMPVCPPPPTCATPPPTVRVPRAVRTHDVTPHAQRIERDQLAAPVVIDFDHDSRGEPVRPGQELDELYLSQGVHLRSSVAGSPIVADEYVVASASKHWSAATRDPRWTGDTEIVFDSPVKAAGFYVAAVAVGGTGLEAYDADGQLLGTIYTDQAGDDFLGVRSLAAPIRRLRVFPVPHVDPNFTIDDLSFEPIAY